MAFVKALREQVWLKSILCGASGSGKSQSALELATGIYNAMKKDGNAGSGIAFIGTEGDRDKLYAQAKSKHGDYTFEYDLLQLEEPYTTDKFIAAIDEALELDYKVIITDSLSAEWKWLNDTHDKMPGNSFTNWSKLKPTHRKLIDKILTANAHIICCARGKDEWLLEEKNGKQVPKKVGLGSQTDKDITYEMMLSLQIDQDTHVAHADKDNTGLWDENRYSVITAKDGVELYNWCKNGVANTTPKPTITKSENIETVVTEVNSESDLKTVKNEIIALAKELGVPQNDEVMMIIKNHVSSGNPNGIKDLDDAKALLEELNNYKKENE